MSRTFVKSHLTFLLLFYIYNCSHAQTFESSNLPIIKINTIGGEIQNDIKIIAGMQIIDNGPGIRNNITDSANNFNGYIGIEYRGSSSQGFPKKSFGMEIWTKDGLDTTASLLGLPEENDWILYAPYTDKSFMRDVLTYKLSNDMGRYASRTVYCELVLNDSYQGIYVLMERIKKNKHRVDISNLNPDENSGDDLTGGYIVKIDKFDGSNSGNGWVSPYRPLNYSTDEQSIYFQYDYPRNNDITAAQMDYIKKYVTAFEVSLANPSYNDIITGYRAYADINSMVDYAIINEISHNVDGYRLSTFIHKDKDSKGGKLIFGPIWDLNLGYGNADYCSGGSYTGWAYRFNDICNQDYWLVPFWWYKLFNDIEFRTLMQERWSILRLGALKTENILNYIDSTALALDEAQQRNFIKWPILGIYIWPNNYIGNSYEDEINYMKNWITERMAWLDQNLNTLPTAIENAPESLNLIVYPNPFRDKINIILPADPSSLITVSIYDVFGNILWSKEAPLNCKTLSWNGCNHEGNPLKKGLYIISMRERNNVIYNQKVIKMD